jgi:nucleotide-binding universal stress UspA family protein
MFKHILVPTDGSRLSAKAVKLALQLAGSTGAKLTGLYVVAPYFPPMIPTGIVAPQFNEAEYKRVIDAMSRRALAALQAAVPGIAVTTRTVTGGEPWKAILATARARKCDLVVMASHGRSGLSGLILGSETAKVLTHSKVPVLVCR